MDRPADLQPSWTRLPCSPGRRVMIGLRSLLLVSIASVHFARSGSPDRAVPTGCPLYLRRSRVDGGGTGVFAGSAIGLGSFIESCPTIPVPRQAAASSALTNYVYAHNSSHDAVVLGVGMMFNHHSEPHVHNVWAGVGTIGRTEPRVDDGIHCDLREPLCDTAFFASGRAALRDEELYLLRGIVLLTADRFSIGILYCFVTDGELLIPWSR